MNYYICKHSLLDCLLTSFNFIEPLISPKRENDGSVKREAKPDLGINYDSDSDEGEEYEEVKEKKPKRTAGLSLDRYWNGMILLFST